MLDHSNPRRTTQLDLQTVAREAQYLDKLPPHQRLRLTMAGTLRDYPGQSLVLAEGAEIDEVHLILHGMVSVSLYEGINPSMWLYVSGPGTLVDMCALLDPPVSPVSIHALTDVEALVIPRATFVDVMQEEVAVSNEILRNLCSRLALVNRVAMKEVCSEYPGPSLN